MENPVWPCPICSKALVVSPLKNKPGFRFDCYGTDEQEHRITVYAVVGKGVEVPSFPEAVLTESKVVTTGASAAGELLDRVSARLGRKAVTNGKG